MLKIIAHRGFWRKTEEKNTQQAFARAMNDGFGIETDFRDFHGELVISHNPPINNLMSAKDFFLSCKGSSNAEEVFALNIKADGLQSMFDQVGAMIQDIDCFFFDMSVPDALGYLDMGFPVFTRQSEWEQVPSFYSESSGVWVDPFVDDSWVDGNLIHNHLDAGKRVCIVSPELHGNSYEGLWRKLSCLPSDVRNVIMLCTDYPDKARSYFNE